MGVRDSIRRGVARFEWETETAPRLKREAAERKAKYEAETAEREAKWKADVEEMKAKSKARMAEIDAGLLKAGIDMPAIRAKYGMAAT